MNRKATIQIGDATYRDKQEALDFLDQLQLQQKPFFGVEIVRLRKQEVETSMYKTIWFKTQENIYEITRVFIKEKMNGVWNYVEFKW